VRLVAGVLIATLACSPAFAQNRDTFSCGSFKAESWREGQLTQWTVAGTTEKGVLRSPPRFECLESNTLLAEIAFAGGNGTVAVYFPDGSDLTYSRQQVDRRNGRWILPIQAKTRIPPALRAAFDYHCKMDMPLSPIPPGSRGDCVP
jgi:hypothetical protein